ncbi:MAG: helix-turn-helix transcriptional regulator [Bacteroidota bacterium]|nr:helix-turn-helix transcriptional regulator [Bacteroidota bacterium]
MSKEKDILVKIGDYIGRTAKAKYKSNVEFANVCDVNESTIRRILLGEQNISIKVLKRICDALDIKLSDLLKETGF